MSIRRQDTEPVPLARAVAELLDRLHLSDLQLRLRMQAWRDGFAAGERVHADDYDRGFADGVAYVKRTQHQIYNALDRAHTRWSVRGQERDRQTFGQPHPRDYPGIGNGAA